MPKKTPKKIKPIPKLGKTIEMHRDLALTYAKGKMLSTKVDTPNFNIRNRVAVFKEYDFAELLTAEDVDGYLRRAMSRKASIMVSKGWSIEGSNEENVKYIKKRMAELALAQGKDWVTLIGELAFDYLRFSNAFLVKQRDVKATSGKVRLAYVKNRRAILDPVAGYFRLDPNRIMPLMDADNSRVQTAWRYFLTDRTDFIDYELHDIVHFHFDKRVGNSMGTPANLPALDDIRALRRLEENLELLVYQHIFPLFTITVGNKETGGPQVFDDGTSEIDVVVEQVQRMANEGGWVIPDRWKIDTLDLKTLLPVEKYIEHFKGRIFTSLGVSSLDMGDGSTANRSTSDTLSGMIGDDIKLYQTFFEGIFNYEIINELLLESSSTVDMLNVEDKPVFNFGDFSLDNQIKKENHAMLQYQSNAISHTEMRKKLKHQPLKSGQKPEMFMQQQADIAENLAKVNGAVKAKNRPSNQHGKKSGPTKRKSSKDAFKLDNELRAFYLLAKSDSNPNKDTFLYGNIIKNICLALDFDYNFSYIESLTKIMLDLSSSGTFPEFMSKAKIIL